MPKRTRKPSATVEWVGGVVPMPKRITDEGEPHRPDMLLWLAPADQLTLEHIVHKITVSTLRGGGPDDVGLPRQVGAVGEALPQYEPFEE